MARNLSSQSLDNGGAEHASLWNGAANAWTDLYPFPTTSVALGTDGVQQAGYVISGGRAHASLWSGSAASWQDLHPLAATGDSVCADVEDDRQVGSTQLAFVQQATIWSGTAASCTSVHPAAASRSHLYGMGSGQQVGFAFVGGISHASLWQGTAASWIDLQPAGTSGTAESRRS